MWVPDQRGFVLIISHTKVKIMKSCIIYDIIMPADKMMKLVEMIRGSISFVIFAYAHQLCHTLPQTLCLLWPEIWNTFLHLLMNQIWGSEDRIRRMSYDFFTICIKNTNNIQWYPESKKIRCSKRNTVESYGTHQYVCGLK